MKQCSRCLRFKPDAEFAPRASQCHGCTNQRDPKPWTANSKPLAKAIAHWRAQ